MAKAADPSAAEKQKLQSEKKKLKADNKAQKKEAKRRAKEIAAQEAELAEDEEGGGFFTFLATLAIIAVWIAIVCVVIKLDVGGFGSGVLRPLLKDVPVINKILPASKTDEDAQDSETSQDEEENGGYTSLSEATEQIKELELKLQQAQTSSLEKDERIANLTAEVARLQQFEDKQVEFQRIQTEFAEEVVYAEKGPGPEEYRKYYEAIEPTIAEYIYRQTVEQQQEDSKIRDYANAYSAMKPKQAAAIFEAMQDNLNLVARILMTMDAESRGNILGAMDAEVAAKLTKIMEP